MRDSLIISQTINIILTDIQKWNQTMKKQCPNGHEQQYSCLFCAGINKRIEENLKVLLTRRLRMYNDLLGSANTEGIDGKRRGFPKINFNQHRLFQISYST